MIEEFSTPTKFIKIGSNMTDKKNLLGAAGLVMQGTMETGFDF